MKILRTCILSQGSEILSGSILNTNAQWISQYLSGSQYQVIEHITVDDDVDLLIASFERLCSLYDVVISTGGLGPTEDDLTAEALAQFSRRPLQIHDDALTMLKEYYQKRNRILPPPVRKQALLPESADIIPNPVGSACGFYMVHENTQLYVFPGVPTEVQTMISNTFQLVYTRSPLVFGTFGASESRVLNYLDGLSLPAMAFHATRRGLWLTIYPDDSVRSDIETEISHRLSDILFDCSETKKSLLDLVATQLWNRAEMVATAESCTSGKLSSWFTSIPGSSGYFKEGVVVYSNASKYKYCGVSEELIQQQGAVCKQVSLDLARGIQQRSNATWGIGITGIAGPGGGTQSKPVGTVHIAVHGHQTSHHKHCTFHGTRDQITDQACGQAMFMLLRAIEGNLNSRQ